MNCVLIETQQGRYCQSHRTWHAPDASWGPTMGARAPACPIVATVRLRRLPWHTCTNDPDGTSDTCPGCLEESTHD